MKVRAAASLALFACLMPMFAMALQAKEFKDYIVHYSAFTADTLHPEVARSYDIRRSPSRVVLNIVVMRKQDGATQAVRADVKASAVNLNEQLKRFNLREVVEGEAIYYLADFPVTNKEVLDFTISATPQGTSQPLEFNFRQQFFTEPPPQ